MDRIIEFATQNPYLVIATILMLIAVIAFELRLRGRAAHEVSTTEAVRMINKGATVVDLRDETAFESGHIVDAIRMSADDLRKGEEGRIKKKRGVLVVCDNGSTSHQCARSLQSAGFEGAFSLAGGIAAWQRDNQPLVAGRK